MKILIPTCTPRLELHQLDELESHSPDCEIVVSSQRAHAAVNRNWCLDRITEGETAIMIDDDIEGFYPGWIDDLLAPLQLPNVVAVSARLLNPNGTAGQTCSRCYDMTGDWHEIKSNGASVMPTAAIAFVHRGHRFDQNYIGSGFEDDDWFQQYLAADPSSRFIQSNQCRLIHRNERKNQLGQAWERNQRYFFRKWKSPA